MSNNIGLIGGLAIKTFRGFWISVVSIDFWAYLYALLGFYHRDGFIWRGVWTRKTI